ncbi:hypothetical protein [Anaerovorax odorimutans]|uniref:hypothetical protein n=1 Tax=Anaerovorax odorimutans TaxID=109327 RepID=UPI0003F7DA5A|nr:hypothetical protein [Anaerovorax odorimutans]
MKKNIFNFILYVVVAFLLGEVLLFIQIKFKDEQMGIFNFKESILMFILSSILAGIFFVVIIMLNNKIKNSFKHGKILGLIGVSVIPLIWIILIILSLTGISKEGYSNFILSNLIFLFSDEKILSYYLILLTIITFNNFINHAHGIFCERGSIEDNLQNAIDK